MLINDTGKELRELLYGSGMTQEKLGSNFGWTRQYVCKAMNMPAVKPNFIKMCEAMGYDIEIHYVPKEEKERSKEKEEYNY